MNEYKAFEELVKNTPIAITINLNGDIFINNCACDECDCEDYFSIEDYDDIYGSDDEDECEDYEELKIEEVTEKTDKQYSDEEYEDLLEAYEALSDYARKLEDMWNDLIKYVMIHGTPIEETVASVMAELKQKYL